jgi:activator of HSP90 ATPase
MTTQLLTRRDFSVALASIIPAIRMGGAAIARNAMAEDEISRTEESIHQEVVFKASRQRVYDSLTDDKQFGKLTGGLPTRISRGVGGGFTLFAGRITGRHVELVPSERIVQAWRSESWGPGVYSIATFALTDQGSDTKLVLDHRGFPKGQAEDLAGGWTSHYWEPLSKYLA